MPMNSRRTNGAGMSSSNREPGQANAHEATAGGGTVPNAHPEIVLGGLGVGLLALLALLIGAQVVKGKLEEGAL